MKKALEVINELKEKRLIDDYAIGGGISALFYIETILTYDLDIFIILPKEKRKEGLILLSPVFKYLEEKGYLWAGEHIVIESIPVQFIPSDELEEEAVKNAKEIEYEKVKTKVLTPEYLIAILLRVGRKKDIEKIEKLLRQTEIDKEKLTDILQKRGLTEKFKF
ncbi:MAG: hypothetical protein AAB267_01620 [Candidatus Desantisbacteria bacterium]